jgi:transposase InsO family protein
MGQGFPTFSNNDTIANIFVFNHIIASFGVPNTIVMDHGSHFRNKVMIELATRLVFLHEKSTPYYPQSNGQVEAINHVLKTVIQWMVGKHKTN